MDTNTAQQFAWYDYLFFAFILSASLTIGLVFGCIGGKQKSVTEYLRGNSKLGLVPVGMSMYMSSASAVAILGNTAEQYTHGIQMWWIGVGDAICAVIGAVLFAPLFFNLKLISYNEYLIGRFNSKAAMYTSTIFNLIRGILYAGLAMYSPATALVSVTPIPLWSAIVVMGVVGTIYTTVGGLKAVVWTDAFQGLTMFAGLLTICILSVKEAGSIQEVWDINQANGRTHLSFDPDPIRRMSFWSVLISTIVMNIQLVGPSQTAVQRYAAVPTLAKARGSSLMIIPLTLMMYVLTFIIGGSVFAYYHKLGCDPLRSGSISNPNQLFPFFILDGLRRPVLPGLTLAILLCAALSSVTTSVGANAAMTWKDFMDGRGVFKDMKESNKAIVNKLLVLLYGGISIGMGFAFQYFPGHASQAVQTINSAASSPVIALFILGVFFPWANHIGAITGAFFGFAINFAQGMGSAVMGTYAITMNTTVSECSPNATINDGFLQNSEDTPAFFMMAFGWFGPLGVVTAVVVGLLVSLMTGGHKTASQVDPRYIIPVFNWTCPCFPPACLRRFWCGVDFSKVLDKGVKDEIDFTNDDLGEKVVYKENGAFVSSTEDLEKSGNHGISHQFTVDTSQNLYNQNGINQMFSGKPQDTMDANDTPVLQAFTKL